MDIKAILLVDNFSRFYLKSDINVLHDNGFIIINSFEELTDSVLLKTHTLITFESSIKNQFSLNALRLAIKLYDLKCYVLCKDKNSFLFFENIAKPYICDFQKVTLDLLLAVVNEDHVFETAENFEVQKDAKVQKIINNILANKSRYDADVLELVSAIESSYQTEQMQLRVLRKLSAENEVLKFKYDLALTKEKNAISEYEKVVTDISVFNRTLAKYEEALSKDLYEKVNTNLYVNKPAIIYLKRYESIINEPEFIRTLFMLITLQLRYTVKVLYLYDNSSCRELNFLPEDFRLLRNNFSKPEIYQNDIIAKTGSYSEVFDVLLTNQTSTDILIVVDCKAQDDIVLTGNGLQLYMCGCYDHLKVYDLPEAITITSDNDEAELVWHNYESELEAGDRFAFLANRPVMQQLYKLIDKFMNTRR